MPTKRPTRHHELTELSLKACQIAEDAAANLREVLDTENASSRSMALLAIRQCEEELDQIERTIDERLPRAMSRVSEDRARELLASLKFITDLERIGDLLLWVAKRARPASGRVPKEAAVTLRRMTVVLETMLRDVRRGFLDRDTAVADSILAADKEIDRFCRALFGRYLSKSGSAQMLDALLMVQALERAGDHATNLAEEIHHLIEGRSLRHAPSRSRIPLADVG